MLKVLDMVAFSVGLLSMAGGLSMSLHTVS